MFGYDNGSELFPGPVPMVVPRLGLGGPLALVAVTVLIGVLRRDRAPRPAD